MEYYIKVIKDNYFNFEGRARRKEYWMFSLIHIIIFFVLGFFGGIFSDVNDDFGIGFILIILYFIATFLPSLAVTVRRLHDTGKSGWYYLVTFIPYIGSIWLFILTVIEGDHGTNQYGPDPKNNYEEINEIGKPLEN